MEVVLLIAACAGRFPLPLWERVDAMRTVAEGEGSASADADPSSGADFA